MKRAVIAGLVVLLGLPLLIVAFFAVSVVASDCRLRSVDEQAYVARNRAILDELPVFPRSELDSSSSNAWIASDACFGFNENGPPYDAFETTDRYTLPEAGTGVVAASWYGIDEFGNRTGPAQVPAVLGFYDRELAKLGWSVSHWSGPEVWFTNGEALLGVAAYVDPSYPRYELGVVHDRG
jgi:hypothetical protein